MAEETVTAPVEQIPGNAPEARTETGGIKDQQAIPPKTEAAKPVEAKPAESEKKPDASAVPEKYELKAPEGATLDEKLIAEATPLFKELGLSQEGAQKLFDFHTKAMQAALEAPTNTMNDMRAEWRGEVVKDPALGNGVGDLKADVKTNVAAAIAQVGDAKAISEFKAAMDLTGAGDNPALIRGLNAIGKILREGTLVKGGAPSPLGQNKTGTESRPSPAQALYPALPSSAQS